jgi:NitT/TauT family transport system ATP-binding protein
MLGASARSRIQWRGDRALPGLTLRKADFEAIEAPPDRSPGAAGQAFCCRAVSVDVSSGPATHRVLDDLTFGVRHGEFVSLVGPSGTGKTTLLRVLAGLQRAAAGSEVLFDGKPVVGPPEGVGVVFQDYWSSLLPWRTVEKNVALGLEGKVPSAERRERVTAALELVGLGHRAKDYPWRLSGGMQQRVQIARALAMESKVLLMDEPFGSVDAMTKAQLQDGLERVQQVTEATVVFVTHDIEEAVYLRDRVLVMTGSPGRISREFPVDLHRPRDQVTTKEQPDYLSLRHAIYAAIRGSDD